MNFSKVDSPQKIDDLFRLSIRNKIDFSLNESSIRSYGHTSRVLFHALNIANELGIDEADKEILIHSALFHDTRRFEESKDIVGVARSLME